MLPGKTLTLADFLQILRRRFLLLTVPPLITTFAALVYSAGVPNLYESDMLIAIDPQRVPDSFVRSTVTLQTDRRLDALQVQVLSRTTLQQVVDEFGLYERERATMPIEDVLSMMRDAVRVDLETPRPRGRGEVQPSAFHVRFTYTDPKLAAAVTQRIGTHFVEQNTRDRGGLASATNAFLESQLSDARGKLESQEQRLEVFRQRHGKELPTQSQTNVQALSSAQMQAQSLVESIARDRDRKLMLERIYREAAAEPPTPVAAAADPRSPGGDIPAGGTPQQQVTSARASLAALELRYTADHPDVVRARRQVAELEARVAADTGSAAGGRGATPTPTADVDPVRRESLRQMTAEIESLDRQIAFKEGEERRVRGEVAEYQRRLEAVPGLESEWVKLTRDYDTLQTGYRDLLAKSSAAQVSANLEAEDIGERFRIVDPATVPIEALASMRLRYNAIGLVIGLFLGIGIVALIELLDRSFRTELDVLEVLDLPVLASVPRIESAAEQASRRRRRQAAVAAGVVAVVTAGYLTWTLKLWTSLV
jgi:polysaccharide chain length determinant protein (PEP-CTERM system associated)